MLRKRGNTNQNAYFMPSQPFHTTVFPPAEILRTINRLFMFFLLVAETNVSVTLEATITNVFV